MADYTYKATCHEIVYAVEEFFNSKRATVQAAHDFAERFSLGKPGFTRCVFTWDFEFGGVSMDLHSWREQHRDEWYKPSKGFSTPKPPKKGGEPSEVYEAFRSIPKASGKAIQRALLGDHGALWAPGLFLHDGAAFIATDSKLSPRDGLVEITQSEFQAASKEASHV
jgi:hypothetical protein